MLPLIVILLISAWCVYDNWYVYGHSTDTDILRYKPGPSGEMNSPDGREISGDMVAWVTVDDTGIDYPIMQADDNLKYLNTDPFGDYSLSGSIFLDSRNASDFSDPYSIVYGHHMDHGKMFGALDSFLNESYLRAHDTGTLMIGRNAEKVCRLEVFAAMRADARSEDLFNPEGSDDVPGCIRRNAEVFINERNDRILALSTCAGDDLLARTIVFCYILE